MTAYLSAAWLDAPIDPAGAALAAEGVDVRFGRIVTKAPDGDARYTVEVRGGEVACTAGVADDVEVTFTDTYAQAVAMLRGELDPNASFIRGRTKVTGPTSQILQVLAATKTEAYEAARAELEAAVELP